MPVEAFYVQESSSGIRKDCVIFFCNTFSFPNKTNKQTTFSFDKLPENTVFYTLSYVTSYLFHSAPAWSFGEDRRWSNIVRRRPNIMNSCFRKAVVFFWGCAGWSKWCNNNIKASPILWEEAMLLSNTEEKTGKHRRLQLQFGILSFPLSENALLKFSISLSPVFKDALSLYFQILLLWKGDYFGEIT